MSLDCSRSCKTFDGTISYTVLSVHRTDSGGCFYSPFPLGEASAFKSRWQGEKQRGSGKPLVTHEKAPVGSEKAIGGLRQSV
jgi:hypothetical protein